MLYSEIKKNLATAYDQQSDARNESPTQDWKVAERDVFLTHLQNEEKQTLLEVGAGPGRDSLFFQQQGLKTLSTDLSPESVRICREKGLDAEVMSFDNLEIPDEKFDAVWALNCLLHIPKSDLPSVLKEIKRVMKPGGLFYMGVYGGQDSEGVWEGDFHEPKRFFSFFQDEDLKEVLSEIFQIEYFNVVPKELVGGPFHFQSVILRKN
ncbi:class I SAM-dependent methyltransferase [Pseudalkalibacillus sp. Hm43]|uniref:class I SAM-dependent methyltransferase n=1 Tax=Pseudalkalibacillus sp. Hm43 TaxID=3450742 RepID=UPI003F43707C